MRVIILLITSLFLLTFCSNQTEQKEKELPSYFCNENLERYFAGNDSLPLININPNDSFGAIKDRVDSIYKVNDYPKFNMPITIDSSYSPVLIKSYFLQYDPFNSNTTAYFSKRTVLEIRLNSAGQLLIEGELGDTLILRKQVFKNLTNHGKDLNFSDDPQYAITSFQWDISVKPQDYYNTLKAIVDGYIDVLKHTSLKDFKKPLCDLNTNEFDSLAKSYPFKLSLSYPETNLYRIPPPPPIFEDEFIPDTPE